MLLAVFTALSLCAEYVVSAHTKSGGTHQFVRVEWAPSSNRPQIIPITTETFERGDIKTFSITRSDGVVLECPAPPVTTSISFRFTLVGETPVSISATGAYRRSKHQVALDRAKPMPDPIFHQIHNTAPVEEDTSVFGMMRKYWYIPLIAMVLHTFVSRAAPQAPAAQ